ncbi:Fic family protein [Hydrogenimonas thermophila]|uniref:Fic family protein n=1 Tax=Hydrogenimonas thermophila TaxID=223786 RepID=A0A1I5U8D7_9BACT|nr:Fic family protein [Hydrogenimonas thermophila]SFP91525.1 Fic family protein [Hydrogenimonas thermophila]
MKSSYTPPYTITSKMVWLTNEITEMITKVSAIKKEKSAPILRKKNRIRSITGSLQIEGNTLNLEEVTALIEGKRVLGTVREIEEVKGAIKAYEEIENYNPTEIQDLLKAHRLMMGGILENAGSFRKGNVGIYGKEGVSHIAPPAYRVDELMQNLFTWLSKTEEHPLISSSVFHYEFEFIHPFSDGNGRIGRLWQSVILGNYREIFFYIPIESIVREHQQSYYKALEESGSAGESTPFIEFMLESVHLSVKEFLKEYQKSSQKSNLKSDQKILNLIKQDNRISIKELALRLNMSESGIKKVLSKLKSMGTIERVGSPKGGYWKIKGE